MMGRHTGPFRVTKNPCPRCGGLGRIADPSRAYTTHLSLTCPECRGDGKRRKAA